MSRMDGGIGLQVRHIGVRGKTARLGRQDAGGHHVLEAVRRGDGHQRHADAQGRKIGDLHGHKFGRVDLEHGEVGGFVDSNQARRVAVAILQFDHHALRRLFDHMRVGDDVTIGLPDEAAAQ